MSGNNGRGQTEKRLNVETSKPEAQGEDRSPIEVAEAALKKCLLVTAQRCAADETRVRKPMAWMVVIGADELATVKGLWAAIQKDQTEKVSGVDMDIAPDQRTNGGRMVVQFAREEGRNVETSKSRNVERIPPRPPPGKGGSEEGMDAGREEVEGNG